MTRQPARLLAAGVLAALLLAAPAAPAARAADEAGVSSDGRSWSDDLDRPLFDPGFRWVPGDVESQTFHLRNRSADPATYQVAVTSVDHQALLGSGDVVLDLRVAGGTWERLRPAPGEAVVDDLALGPGRETTVELRASFDPAAGNDSQRSVADLRLRVLLAGIPPEGDQGVGPSALPATGAPAVAWPLALGAVLCGMGLALVRRSRREEPADG